MTSKSPSTKRRKMTPVEVTASINGVSCILLVPKEYQSDYEDVDFSIPLESGLMKSDKWLAIAKESAIYKKLKEQNPKGKPILAAAEQIRINAQEKFISTLGADDVERVLGYLRLICSYTAALEKSWLDVAIEYYQDTDGTLIDERRGEFDEYLRISSRHFTGRAYHFLINERAGAKNYLEFLRQYSPEAVEQYKEWNSWCSKNAHKDFVELLRRLGKYEQFFHLVRTDPSDLLVPTEKVSRLCLNNAFEQGEKTAVFVGNGKKNHGLKRKINAYVTFEYECVDVEYSVEIDAFDRCVFYVICSYAIAGHEYITVQQIVRFLVGGGNKNPSKALMKDVDESILKMLPGVVTIDSSEETEFYPNLARKFIKGHVLPARFAEGTINGAEVRALHLTEIPLLLERAMQKGQVARFTAKTLRPMRRTKTGEVQILHNESKKTITIRAALLEEIGRIRGGATSNVIKIDTFIERNHLLDNLSESTQRRERASIIKYMDLFLSSLRDFAKEIKGYKFKKVGAKVDSVSIDAGTGKKKALSHPPKK